MTTYCTPAEHAALKISAEWATLHWVGLQITEADETGPEERFEVRDCRRCGNTLCKKVA